MPISYMPDAWPEDGPLPNSLQQSGDDRPDDSLREDDTLLQYRSEAVSVTTVHLVQHLTQLMHLDTT